MRLHQVNRRKQNWTARGSGGESLPVFLHESLQVSHIGLPGHKQTGMRWVSLRVLLHCRLERSLCRLLRGLP